MRGTFSSMLFSTQKRKTCTSFFWPMRCARSMAWARETHPVKTLTVLGCNPRSALPRCRHDHTLPSVVFKKTSNLSNS